MVDVSNMIVSFPELDNKQQEFLAQSVSQLLATQLQRQVAMKKVLEIFLASGVEVKVEEDGTMNLLKNEKLEAAVKKITAIF